jgi:two-component system, LuxR family, sensor kinase FixL
VHLVVWVKQTEQRAHLLFSMTAISVAAIAACELLLMRAQTTEQFCTVLRWAHVPVFFAVVSIVAFVRLYFRAGRPWLAYLVCGLRLLALIINFLSGPNLNYKQITGLLHLTTLGGETISVAEGVPNPWTKLGELSSLLLLVFVADASVTLWRRGDRTERRRALVVGGSTTFSILVAAGNSALLHAGLIHTPYLSNQHFLFGHRGGDGLRTEFGRGAGGATHSATAGERVCVARERSSLPHPGRYRACHGVDVGYRYAMQFL